MPLDYNHEHAQCPGMGLWHWRRLGDKRQLGSIALALLHHTKGWHRQQQELWLENFVLELLWVMNPHSWGDSCQPGPRAVGYRGSTTMGEAAF